MRPPPRLSKNEARVWAAIRAGELFERGIATHTGLKRRIVRDVLDRLILKQLVIANQEGDFLGLRVFVL
jgi:transcription initiation factor IIE alpha subunit